MAINAQIVHHIPGRVRLRIPDKRGDFDYFSSLSEELSGIDAVQAVKTNARTGSVVIEFPDSLDGMVEGILHQYDIDVAPDQKNGMRPSSAPGTIDMRPLHLVSGRNINPMFMIGSLLTVAGLMQTFRGKIMAPSIPLFWYAMEAFRESRKTS